MNKKIKVLLLIIIITFTFLTGCNTNDQSLHTQNILRYNHGEAPNTLDPSLSLTVGSGTIILANYEGLTKFDENNTPVAGVAEKWDISPDKTKYTFHLREDAKWSDGKPVTAQDFYYSWKRALDPATNAEFSYLLYSIKNAEKYNINQAQDFPFEKVGITVLDNHTLEVELESPIPYFLQLTALPTFVPLRADLIAKYGDKWALSPESYIGNGPFKMTEWKKKDMLKLVPNEYYYNKDQVKLAGLEITFIPEESTMFAAFKAEELDVIDSVPLEEVAGLKKESSEFKVFPMIGTYYYSFNVQKPPFDNIKVRKAFNLAINRTDLVTKVRKTGIPASAFVSPGVSDAEPASDFREIGGSFLPTEAQPEKAKELLAEAGFPEGKDFPPVTLIYSAKNEHKMLAEAVLEMLKEHLGISNITLANQEGKVFMQNKLTGNFQISLSMWITDVIDPITFLEIYTTNNGNNDTQWSNGEYDQLIKKARFSSQEQERYNLLHQAEKILLDDAPIMPLFHFTENCMIKPYVKNLYKSPLGYTYFDKVNLTTTN